MTCSISDYIDGVEALISTYSLLVFKKAGGKSIKESVLSAEL